VIAKPAAGELDRAHHPDRVLAEPDVRVADRPDQAGVQVVQAADVVDHGVVGDVVEEPVDREVAPQRVLPRRSEHVVGRHEELRRLRIERLGAATEGRNLDDLPFGEQDVGEPEPPADQPAVAEEAAHRLWRRVRPDVEVLGRPAEQEVPHASPHEVGLVPGGSEPVEHLQRVRIDVLARDGMLAPGADSGKDLFGNVASRFRGGRGQDRRVGFQRFVLHGRRFDYPDASLPADSGGAESSARVPVAPGPIVAQLSDRIEVLTLLRALRKNTQSFLTTRRGGFRE